MASVAGLGGAAAAVAAAVAVAVAAAGAASASLPRDFGLSPDGTYCSLPRTRTELFVFLAVTNESTS